MIILLNLVFLSGCKKSDISFFTDARYIRFAFSTEDDRPSDYYVTSYSFGYDDESVTSKVLKIPVQYHGYNLTEGLTYSVQVDEKITTLSKECYVINKNSVINPVTGNIDSLEVKIIRKTDQLQQVKVLRLFLVSNNNFTTTIDDCLFAEIRVDDIFGIPGWWDNIVVNTYLGTYSETKYRAFMDVTGIIDFGELDSGQKIHYARIFKRDLEANPRSDENGPMSVPIAG